MTVPYQYPSKLISIILSVPMRHSIIAIGMADLGGTSPDLEKAGEWRLRRKRSPRCKSSAQTLLGPAPTAWALKGWGALKTPTHFTCWHRWYSSVRINGIFKVKSSRCHNEISLIFHYDNSNLPIDFVKIGGR
jgi:hypothetical protein